MSRQQIKPEAYRARATVSGLICTTKQLSYDDEDLMFMLLPLAEALVGIMIIIIASLT